MPSESLDAGSRSERSGAQQEPDPYLREQRSVLVDLITPFDADDLPGRPPGDGGVRLSPVTPVAVRSIPGMGRGVVATRAIGAGEDFGRFPLLEVPDTDPALTGVINNYVFGRSEGPSYLVLGWPSLMNHLSGRPNVDREWVETSEGWMLRFFAVADVRPGEQLFIDYGCPEWWAQ